MSRAGFDAADPVRWPIAPRVVRSRRKGVVNPEGIDVTRPGRFGNPFRVDGAAAKALAGQHGPVSWSACQWAAARLYAVALALREDMDRLPRGEASIQLGDVPFGLVTMVLEELCVAAGEQMSRSAVLAIIPTRAEIMETLGGQPLRCWCKLQTDCHGDVLRGIAAGWAPLDTIPARPLTKGGIRHLKPPHPRIYPRGHGGGVTNW